MSTPEEARQLRRAVGFAPDDTVAMSQAEADALYADALAWYPGSASPLASTAIIYFEGLLANTAKMYRYRQNQTENFAGDVFEHVKYLIEYWQKKLLAAEVILAGEDGSVRSGRTMQIPTRWKEYPDG